MRSFLIRKSYYKVIYIFLAVTFATVASTAQNKPSEGVVNFVSPKTGNAGSGVLNADGEYEIRHLMPEADPKDPSYRIKSIAEKHERVVPESELKLSASHDRTGGVFAPR